MRNGILALVAALLVVAAPAFAGEGEKGKGELGIYGGYGWLDDYGIFHPKNGFLYGARLGYFFTEQWSLEGSAQRLGTKTEFEVLGLQDEDVHLDALRINLLYNFRPGESMRPFLTVGVGQEKFSAAGFGSSCDVGWNAGGGIRWITAPHWNIRTEGRYVHTSVGGTVDEAQNNIEATVGLSWLFGGSRAEPAAAVTEAPPNAAPVVTCASDRPEILPGETVVVRATASDPDGDPLTYEWSTTSGHVSGTGPTTTLDFAGTNAPASAAVSVRVSDGHGHIVSCNTAVALNEPARAAEAVSCLAGGFPKNLSRLNNVDKACLDDMAQRLKADPRSRAVIVGHADSHERSAEDVGEQRAKAVRDYLVGERGIDASRVSVRSAAATKPLDAGVDAAAQSHNRRVEVWFVPEGAKEPE